MASLFYFLLIICMVGAGIGLALLDQLTNYPDIKAMLDRYSYSGGVDFFTESYYEGVLARANLAGLVLIVTGGLAGLSYRWSIPALRCFLSGLGDDMRQAVAWIRCDRPQGFINQLLFWVLFLGGALLAILFIRQPVRADEAQTFVSFAMRPFWVILTDWTAPNNQILHTLLVRCVYLVSGAHEGWLRLPAFLAGIALLPLLYLFGRKYYDNPTGLLMMAYAATHSVFVNYASTGRGYSILYCCTYLLFIAGILLLNYPGNRAGWLMAGMAGAAGFMAIPSMLYSFAGFGLWMALSQPEGMRSHQRWRWIMRLVLLAAITAITVLLFYLPAFLATDWTIIARDEALVGAGSWEHVVKQFDGYLPSLAGMLSVRPVWLGIVVVVVGVCGYLMRIGRQSPCVSLWVCVLLVSVVFPVLIQKTIPYGRIYTVFFPLVFAIPFSGLAFMMSWLRNDKVYTTAKFLSIAIFFLIAGVTLLQTHPDRQFRTMDHFPAAKDAADYLLSSIRQGDSVISYAPSVSPMRFYARQQGLDLRIIDLIEFQPQLHESSDGRVWIVVNKEQGRGLASYLWLMDSMDLMPLAILAKENPGMAIYRLDQLEVSGLMPAKHISADDPYYRKPD